MSILAFLNQQFSSITADSRRVQPNALFLAYPGAHSDGRDYIPQAIERGATAVLWEQDAGNTLADPKNFVWNQSWQVSNLAVSDLKQQIGQIAAEYYHHPSQQLTMVGVTGTNGKTSVSQWLAQCLTVLGKKTAVLGTLGNGLVDAKAGAQLAETINTTPDAIQLQGLLADFVQQEADAVVMEVSSHGLDQGRVNAVAFDIAVLTNLSRDHLDYHGNMQDYAAAKEKLFACEGLNVSVLNADDAFGQAVAKSLKAQGKSVLTYGLQQGDIRATELKLHQLGLSIQVITPQGNAMLSAPVLGRFNAYNLLAVLATLLALDVGLEEAIAVIGQIKSVAGRMQQLGGGEKPLVVVDYAHTPDALEKVLSTLREQLEGKLICVFGCGGNRDAGKRPLMGEVASRLADRVIVTSDNPRNENPASIINAITQDMGSNYLTEPDRAKAIQLAVQSAQAGDIVLVAGKGHENYQEIAGVKTPFSDLQVVQTALQQQGVDGMLSLAEAATALNAQIVGADAMFASVGADSRHITQGQLFVALKGEKFDGHNFAQQAIVQGAAAVMVDHPVAGAKPALLVNDTYQALGALAAYWRSKFSLPLAVITGSSGKTTVKEMLASIVRAASASPHQVLATQGNLNNHIGLPLTLLKLTAQHRYAVIEMGMNHTGEIDYLTRIAQPTVALINNAGTAHIGELGSAEAIAKAKGEIFAGLAAEGVAIINADDVFAPLWQSLAGAHRIITFGLNNQADISADYQLQADASLLEIRTPQGAISVRLPAPGLHNVLNALAATATALAMQVPLAAVATGLENYAGAQGRLQPLKGINGAQVIDDSYNANPASMKAAIDVLRAKAGEKILVLGDMGELGADASELHAAIGRYAKASGIDALLTLGNLSQAMTREFGAGAVHYTSPQALVADLRARMQPSSVVLVKGSRFMAMERIVKEITVNYREGVH